METIKDLLADLRDFNIYIEEDGQEVSLEEHPDDFDEMFFELELTMYNNYIDDTFSQEWKDCIINHGEFLIKKDGSRVYLKEFIPFVYSTKDDWRMKGDEEFISDYRN